MPFPFYYPLFPGHSRTAAGCVRGHPAGAAHHHAFLSPRAGDLSDKYGPRGIASIGLVLTALGLTAFALFPRVPVSGAAIFLVFIGLGAALFGAPNNSAIMGSVKKMHHGIASSILALSRNLGQALSMAVVTFIMTTETAKQPSYTDGVLAACMPRSSS